MRLQSAATTSALKRKQRSASAPREEGSGSSPQPKPEKIRLVAPAEGRDDAQAWRVLACGLAFSAGTREAYGMIAGDGASVAGAFTGAAVRTQGPSPPADGERRAWLRRPSSSVTPRRPASRRSAPHQPPRWRLAPRLRAWRPARRSPSSSRSKRRMPRRRSSTRCPR